MIVLSAVLLLLSLSFWNIWKRNRQNTLIEQQKNNILKQKLLVSQMNPHFIFNSLNAIQNCIFKSDPKSAGNYLSRFADLMRMILDYSFENRISLADEIHFLESYMDLQRFRFEYKFDFEINVAPSLDTSQIGVPPMLAQPFVENAIEHGLAPLKKQGLLRLSITGEGSYLLYEIRDNGVGLTYQKKDFKKHESRALNITRERIDNLFYNREDLVLSIEDLGKDGSDDTGVCVRFKLPIQELEV